MARELTAVTTMTAAARLTGSLHVGAADPTTGADAPVFRDARGRVLIPGTSIAGALRAALPDDGVWGTQECASRIVVHDALLTASRHTDQVAVADPPLGRRDGVAIDRAWGGAADGLLYGRETVAAGAWAALCIDLHSVPATESTDLEFLGALRALLQDELRLGARTSRGLGRLVCAPKHLTVRRVDHSSAQAYWRTRRTPEPVNVPPRPVGSTAPALDIEITWRAIGPVVVSGGDRGASALRLPLVEPAPDQEGKLRLVLPGSSIAGALRSRAELVCRTLRGTPTPDGFAEQLASTPLVQAVWGAAAGEPGATHSAVEVRDCPSTTTVSATAYLTLLTGDQAPRSVAASGGAQLRVTDHVSVDRWTGGAADGRLFSEVEPHGVTYEPIRLRLRTDRLSPGVRDAATALLLVTLRELVEGRIPLGGATHRGYGTVAVDHIRITGGPEWSGPGLELLDPAFAAQRTAWRTWIDTEDPDGSR